MKKKSIATGWIIISRMGKDFKGNELFVHLGAPYTPPIFKTKKEAMYEKSTNERVVRATVTTEWDE